MPPRRKSSTRIAELERKQAGEVALTLGERRLLVQILGRRDAMFFPWRVDDGSRPPMTEIRSRQQDYLSGRCGLSVKADGRHEWKAAQATRQKLITAGAVEAVRSSGQVQSILLTRQGEADARGLVGSRLCTIADYHVRRLFAIVVLHQMIHDSPIRESELFGGDCVGDPQDWNDSTELMLPLLTAGVVVARSDTEGRILYQRVDGVELTDPPQSRFAADPEFDGIYLRSFADEQNQLRQAEPRDSAALFIPVGASSYWTPQEVTNDHEKQVSG